MDVNKFNIAKEKATDEGIHSDHCVNLCEDYTNDLQQTVLNPSPIANCRGVLRNASEHRKCSDIMYTSTNSKEDVLPDQSYIVVSDVLKAQEHCYTGHFTRGVKKSLQTALSKGLVCAPVTSCCNSVSVGKRSNLLASQPSSSTTYASTSQTVQLISTPFNSLLTSPTNEADRAVRGNGRNVSPSQSIIAHILTGEDKNLGADTMVDNVCADILSEEDKSFVEPPSTLDVGCSDVDSFLDDSLRGNSIMEKFNNAANNWDLDIRDCQKKETAFSPTPSLVPAMDSGVTFLSALSKCVTYLIVHNDDKGVELKQEIMQALQLPDIKVIKLDEVADVCTAEYLNLIWVHVPQPVQEELLAVVASLRYSNKENKYIYFIAITDQQTDIDLHLHGFDDVYIEPIPKDTIHQKYKKFKFQAFPEASSTDGITMQDMASTPASTISIEDVKTTEYSQSSTCDSVSSGIDISDINIPDLKNALSGPICSKSPYLSESTETGGRSPVMDPQSPPSWCRVEHATKEKQRSLERKLPIHTEKERRERIKDSCDQLRVLLPYVKGRKTDMASILEMTVDYLKIVNAALPQDFQTHVIDMMSKGTSVLEGRLGEIERITMTSKKIRRRDSDLDTSPVDRPQLTTEKTNIQTDYTCSSDPILSNKMVTRSLSRTDNYTVTLDMVNSNRNVSTINSCTNSSANNTSTINRLALSKREFPIMTKSGSSSAKKPHVAVASAVGDIHSPAVVYLPTGNATPVKEAKKENTIAEVPGLGHHFTGSHFPHSLTEGDISSSHMFPPNNMTSDIFTYQDHIPMTTPTARVSATSDRGDLSAYGGMYFDGAFYHYYSPLQDSSSGNYFIPGGSNEYVNPNAVVPMTTYTPRTSAFNTSRKFDRIPTELDRFGMGDQNSMLNNNCSITGLKPNNS